MEKNSVTKLLSSDPNSNLYYYGSVSTSSGTIVCQASVTVTGSSAPPPGAPTCTITANPSSINQGQSSTLTVSITGATYALLNAEPFAIGETNIVVQPEQSTPFALQISGPGGIGQCGTSVDVAPTPPALTAQLVSNLSSVNIQMGFNGAPTGPSSPVSVTSTANLPGAIISSLSSTPGGISCDGGDHCTFPTPGNYQVTAAVSVAGQTAITPPINISVVAIPPPDPCQGLSGNYSGGCYADGGSQPATFIISANGAQCLLRWTGAYACLNQSIVTVSGPGAGSTEVTSPAGCAADNPATMTLSAGGVWSYSSYNYAGNFAFSCHN